LNGNIKEFKKNISDFRADYEKSGPMVEGISPNDAMERLRRFEEEYKVKDEFYTIYRKGENLFGL